MLTPSYQLFFKTSRPAVESTQPPPPTQWLQKALFQELSGWGTDADHSLPSCTQLVNVYGCDHSTPYYFDDVVLN